MAPGINRPYDNPDVDDWERTFERPGRELFDYRHTVGPSGRVYAVDITPEFVASMEGRALIVIDFRKVPGFSSPWVMGHGSCAGRRTPSNRRD